MDYQYEKFIQKWKLGHVDGGIGINAKNISGHVRRYLFDKYNNTCALCGWNKVNPFSLRSALEVDHIDGDSENNAEANLRVICPNCHSLTGSYRNLNMGNGRAWRKLKYRKINE